MTQYTFCNYGLCLFCWKRNSLNTQPNLQNLFSVEKHCVTCWETPLFCYVWDLVMIS